MSVHEYPLKPHFYIVNLGFAGVYLFFLFLLKNIDCGYMTIYDLSKNKKNITFSFFYNIKNHCILDGHVFEMSCKGMCYTCCYRQSI